MMESRDKDEEGREWGKRKKAGCEYVNKVKKRQLRVAVRGQEKWQPHGLNGKPGRNDEKTKMNVTNNGDKKNTIAMNSFFFFFFVLFEYPYYCCRFLFVILLPPVCLLSAEMAM